MRMSPFRIEENGQSGLSSYYDSADENFIVEDNAEQEASDERMLGANNDDEGRDG